MTASMHHVGAKWLLAMLVISCMISLGGCAGSGGGNLAIHGYGAAAATAPGQFGQGIYRMDDANTATLLLFEGPLDQPKRAMTLRLFWVPRAGRTPIDATATNTVIQYIVFTGEDRSQVGVYSGAGFLYPGGKLGRASFRGQVWDANLRLADRSEAFEDRLHHAVLTGKVSARRDDAAVDQALRQLNQTIQQRLGYPRLVQR